MGKKPSIISRAYARQRAELVEGITRKKPTVLERLKNRWRQFRGQMPEGLRVATTGQPYRREVQFEGGRNKYGIPKVPEGKGREPGGKNAASGREGRQERFEGTMERQRKP